MTSENANFKYVLLLLYICCLLTTTTKATITFLQQQEIGYIISTDGGLGTDLSDAVLTVNTIQVQGTAINDTTFTFNIPDRCPFNPTFSLTIKSANKNFVPAVSPSAIAPVITNITSAPTSGGVVTVTGHFLQLTNFNSPIPVPYTVSLLLGQTGYTCSQASPIDLALKAITCMASPGAGVGFDTTIRINDIPNHASDPHVLFGYNPPTIINTTNTTQLGGNITIKGTNFFDQQTQVIVGDLECANPTVLDYATIICELPSIGDPPRIIVSVTVNVANQTTTEAVFQYDLSLIKQAKRRNDMKWKIPAIIFGTLGSIAIIACVIHLAKKVGKQLSTNE
ncbi:hypothetical protein SAMD00019534_049660 [Acytostelium subglobosum LB1]|uniref:hypothetical protein n=1 Tax=Acytostelium subglobosum LB1 TaxID=1410327 RepID=UPI0006449C01|nr:hypothetical protein SAMD00019534_049660 [Acytostelium subglobosum LB1]GAM21791.1 hypothetical protein SAMD00019534_049660 [Acytostelium subglobosum LB1]|eukprot:XP_012754891.1 hypothetical protein SAMD00019534_049660 [Acytostelium subglobosum LB1]